MAITIYDIAKEAKLSHSAVSMALRGASGISAATRARVLSLAVEMGYRPNASARSLKSAETRIISAIMPLEQRTTLEIITRVQSECENRGYQVLWQNLPSDPSGARRVLEYACKGYSDAMLMMLYDYETVGDLLENYLKSGRPMAVFGVPQDLKFQEGLLPIDIDNLRAVRGVTEMLIAQGHRHIVHVRPENPSPIDQASHRTIEETMRSHGVDDAGSSFHFGFSLAEDMFANGARCAELLLRQRPEVTAVECPNDIFAIGLIRRLSELGVRVPHDISVVGSDNTLDANHALVRLTSIDMKYREAAVLGCRLLCEQLTEHNWAAPPQPVKLQAEVVLRDSTGPAPRNHKPNIPETPQRKGK